MLKQDSCEKERQELEDALIYLVEIAKSYTTTSIVLEKKPREIREAIKRLDDASEKFWHCRETRDEMSDKE